MKRFVISVLYEAAVITGILLALIKGASLEEITAAILGALVLCLLPLYKSSREGEERI